MLLPTARAPLRLPECRHVADDAPRFGCFRIKRQRAAKAHASGSGNEEPVSEAIDAGAEAEAVHGEPAGLPSLYEQSVTAARTKRLGVGISATFMAVSLVAATQIGILPAPSAEALALPLGCVGVLGMGAAAAFWAANGGRVHVEWHENRMWVETGVPPDASLQPLPVGSIQVRPTGDGRGNGAFALVTIPAESFVGEYEGDLLDLKAFYARYPTGQADYCIGTDSQWCLDGAARSCDTSLFSPCHINHSSTRHNVARRTLRRDRRVELFTTRDISPGEELLLDYGKQYWVGREGMQLP